MPTKKPKQLDTTKSDYSQPLNYDIKKAIEPKGIQPKQIFEKYSKDQKDKKKKPKPKKPKNPKNSRAKKKY